MVFDKPIIIQKIDKKTEQWADVYRLHARVNKTGGSEYLTAGANQSKSKRTFEVRYHKDFEDIDTHRGSYRIIYRGNLYNIEDYDDYLETHRTIKLLGVSVNGKYTTGSVDGRD
jgi:SPP1 family predicted phage head-tail adaptor